MVGIWLNFITPHKKIGGRSPKKIMGPKTCKILVNFGPLQTLIANISGTAADIQNRKTVLTMAIPPAFNEKKSGVLWSTNGFELHVSLDPLKCTFLGDYISAHRALIFLHALEIDQALLAHTPTGTGVPPQIFLIVKM